MKLLISNSQAKLFLSYFKIKAEEEKPPTPPPPPFPDPLRRERIDYPKNIPEPGERRIPDKDRIPPLPPKPEKKND